MRPVIVKNDSEMVLAYAESFIEQTRLDLKVIEQSFFKIGFRLNEAVDNNYVQALGYQDIYELAEDQFGFKKTTTKNLMEVNRTYSTGCYGRPSMELADNFKGFSQTQLVEMLPLGPWSRQNIPTTFTARDIRDYKKIVAVGFDYKTVGAESFTDLQKNPAKYIGIYRAKKLAGEIPAETKKPAEIKSYSAEEHTSFMKDIDKLISPKKSDDVVPGQREIDVDSSEVVGEETYSFNYDQPDVDVPEEVEGAETFVQGYMPKFNTILIDEVQAFSERSSGQSTDQLKKDENPPMLYANVPVRPVGQSTDQKEIYYHFFQTDEQRKSFIENVVNYPTVVLWNEELGLNVRRCDFKNGAKLYRSEYYTYSSFKKKMVSEYKYHLVVPEGDEIPGTSAVCSDVSGKSWTMDGVAITYIVKYLAKHRREL